MTELTPEEMHERLASLDNAYNTAATIASHEERHRPTFATLTSVGLVFVPVGVAVTDHAAARAAIALVGMALFGWCVHRVSRAHTLTRITGWWDWAFTAEPIYPDGQEPDASRD